jgi:2-phospho-L-lactate guanylyltransferase (CobY/MobA/RfbA family)
VELLPSLSLDVDTPDDLDAMAALLEVDPERATATAVELVRLGRIASGGRE